MASLIECIGSQILREARLTEKISAAAADRLHRHLGLVAALVLAVLNGGLLLHFLEAASNPAMIREGLTPDAFRSVLTLAGSSLVTIGYFPVAFGTLYRLWITKRSLFAVFAAGSISAIAVSPTMGLSLVSLAPLLTMALITPEQAASPSCWGAAAKCGCAKSKRKAKGC